jgi:hypothetical protein
MAGLSTWNQDWFQRTARLLGAAASLVKPFPLDQLLIAVRSAIGAPR